MTRLCAIGLAMGIVAAGCGKPPAHPPLASEVTDFRTLFAENCSGCHGAEGRGGAALDLNNPVYLSIIPRDALQQTIENGRPGTSMPAFARNQGGPLYPKQVQALLDGMEQNWAKPVHLTGANVPAYSASGGDPKAGATVFEEACAQCHGEGGDVGPVVNSSYLALASDQGIRTTVIAGRPSLGMPDFQHQQYHGGLTNDDVTNVVAWLSSQRTPVTRPEKQE